MTLPQQPTTPSLGLVTSLAGATALSALANAVVPVALKELSTVYRVSVTDISWVLTVFSAACAIAFALTGWLARRFGPQRCFAASLTLFTLSSLLCGLANSLPMLLVFRVVQGFSAGALIPLALTLLLAAYPSRPSMATAMWGGGAMLAPIFGPLLGGFIAERLSWHWVFLINVPLGALIAVGILARWPAKSPQQPSAPMDWPGLALLIVWMAGLLGIFGMTRVGQSPSAGRVATLIGLSCLMAWALRRSIVRARTVDHPLLDLRLFEWPTFALANASIGIAYAIGAAHMVLLPLWMHQSLGYSILVAGAIIAVAGLSAFATSSVLATVGDRLDARWTASAGAVLFALVLWLRASHVTDTHMVLHIGLSVLQGVGTALTFVPLTTWSLSDCPADRHAAAAGTSSFTRSLSGSLGIAIAIPLWDWALQMQGVGAVLVTPHPLIAPAAARASQLMFEGSALFVLALVPLVWSGRFMSSPTSEESHVRPRFTD